MIGQPTLTDWADEEHDAREAGIEHLEELLSTGACPDDDLQQLHQALFDALYMGAMDVPFAPLSRIRPEITRALARHLYDWYVSRAAERAAERLIDGEGL